MASRRRLDDGAIVSAVWKEACRHIEIAVSTTAIATILEDRLPLRAILVAQADAARRTIETIAIGSPKANYVPRSNTAALSPTAWRKLTAWLRAGHVSRQSDQAVADWIGGFATTGGGSDMITGPLGPDGILILVSRPGTSFASTDDQLIAQLLEPFAAALESDRRLHELRALREAAEADRRTLLSRLGRQAVNEDVVGARTGLKQVMERVQLVAESDIPVLILGETGTGKEVVSRAIHARSKRADGPFIRVNCGAIPSELIDSQLFGHEKGSFTGASDQHQGWFERADRGTLFLDEIGELPLPAQVRLLRVLQDHQIERVGGRTPIHVDVRIVAATHRDLAAMAKDRSFREDLWYRINVFPILLPTLRERVDDIPDLVEHFVQRAAVRFGLPPVVASPSDLRLLTDYHWPGNIRELNAVIDRAVILGGGRHLDVATALGLGRAAPPPIPPDVTMYEVIPESSFAAETPTPRRPAEGKILPLAAAMRQHIERALAATRGRVEGPRGAAALLQINPHTLRARMRKLGVDPEPYRD
jgi:transcriptional regulator with GAF, ATPase, and Fis domain